MTNCVFLTPSQSAIRFPRMPPADVPPVCWFLVASSSWMRALAGGRFATRNTTRGKQNSGRRLLFSVYYYCSNPPWLAILILDSILEMDDVRTDFLPFVRRIMGRTDLSEASHTHTNHHHCISASFFVPVKSRYNRRLAWPGQHRRPKTNCSVNKSSRHTD